MNQSRCIYNLDRKSFRKISLCLALLLLFQLIEKDPNKAVPLFWAAINSGERIESALKDMATVLKQANRTEEAIEAIRSFRDRCPNEARESLDNILLDLYKVSRACKFTYII